MRVTASVARTIAAALLAAASVAPAFAAEPYPSRAVTLVVPFPPGGGADLLARLLGKSLSETWGQTVIVVNRPGAAGTIGAGSVGKSEPDGYTLLVGASGAITPGNAAELAPISLLSAPPYIVAINPSLPVSTLKEFVAYTKARPGVVTYGSSGAGSASHLSGELFMALTQTKMVHVPYKGMGQSVQDLIGGHVTVMFGPPPALLPHIKAGKLKALAVTSLERSPLFKELPTAAEEGVSGFEARAWYGIFAPAKTPQAVIAKVSADATRALASAEIKDTLAATGATPIGGGPAEFQRFLVEDIAKWDDLMKKAGVTQ